MSSTQPIQPILQSFVRSCPSFLALPPEIRVMIYRFLHINSRTIGDSRNLDTYRHSVYQFWDWDQFFMDWHGPGGVLWNRHTSQHTARKFDPGTSTCKLSGQMLATCNQIYAESSEILYGENTFGLHIYVRESHFSHDAYKVAIEASFYEGFEIHELDQPWPAKMLRPRSRYARKFEEIGYQFPVDKIQRLRLVVDFDLFYGVPNGPEFNFVAHTLYKISRRIAHLQLQHLNVDLRCRFSDIYFCILDPLMILRNVRKVTFEPEPQNLLSQRRLNRFPSLTESRPKSANFFKRRLESSELPSDHFLEYYKFQSIATYLGTIKNLPPMIYDYLKLLVENRQELMCFCGPLEVCHHRTDISDSRKHRHLQDAITGFRPIVGWKKSSWKRIS